MIRGLYSAATALDAAISNQELIADNLANVSTPGFRRHGLIFQSLQSLQGNQTPTPPSNIRNAPPPRTSAPATLPLAALPVSSTPIGTQAAGQYTSFTPGPMQYTGNPFDLAISGDNAFFVLEGPAGLVYTRNGVFQLNQQGQLQSASGMPLRSVGGKITVQPGTKQVTIGRDGTVYGDDGLNLGQLQIAEFPNPNNVLQRVGTTLFSGPNNPQQQSATGPTYRIEQGYRENSNVEAVTEMVSMITGMRLYEAAERALRALGEAVSQNTKPL